MLLLLYFGTKRTLPFLNVPFINRLVTQLQVTLTVSAEEEHFSYWHHFLYTQQCINHLASHQDPGPGFIKG